jgi:hypothetical protein
MLSSALFLSIPCLAVVVVASMGGAGYDTSRVGPSNADCDRKTYQLNINSNNTVFDSSLSSTINEVLCYSLDRFVLDRSSAYSIVVAD